MAGEVARCSKRFKAIVGEIKEVNEAICAERPVAPLPDGEPPRATVAEEGGASRTSKRSSPRS